MPEQDLERFKVWSDHLARALEPLLTPEEVELVHQSDQQLAEYFRAIIEQRRREPRDDLVSRLAGAEDEGDKLTPDETIVKLRLLLTAGNETTTNLIGNGFGALLRHPAQLTLLRERPELAAAAVEELLRYDSPVQLDMRITIRDLEIGNVAVQSGTLVTLAIGSANHDPERFDRIGFGPRAPRYRPSVVFRGLEHFDVRVGRASVLKLKTVRGHTAPNVDISDREAVYRVLDRG